MLAARNVPIITAVRIVIFATSFAFIFTVIVVLLWDLGNSCSVQTVASDFSKAGSVPNP
jgi:hypothetical protein